MKRLKETVLANDKAGPGFYRMRIGSGYLAKNTLPGQFFEVRVSEGTEPLLRRPFSCHRILKGAVEILYEVVGPSTEILARKKKDDTVDIIGPLGNGFDICKGEAMIVAGGIGTAPLFGLAEKLKKKPTVLIGARTKDHLLCEKEFKGLGCEVKVATDDGSKGHKGFVTDLLKGDLRNTQYAKRNTIYACGPHVMMKEAARIARSCGAPCQVSLEERMACGVGVCLGCPVKVRTMNDERRTMNEYKMVCKDGPVFDAYGIMW